jgi:peptidoglycan-associated lipoprotein
MIAKKLVVTILSIAILASCGGKASKSMKKGNAKLKQGEYELAIQHFRSALDAGADAATANYKIAESYRLSNRLQESPSYYKAALDAGSKEEACAFYYGHALKSVGQYDPASNQFSSYLKTATNFDFINKSKKEIENLKKVKDIVAKEEQFQMLNVEAINTNANDYGGFFTKDGIYLTSSRGEGKVHAATGEKFSDIFIFKFDNADMTSGFEKPLDKIINTDNRHESDATLTPDGKVMVFARANDGTKKGGMEVQLYSSIKGSDDTWSEPKKLDFNDVKAWNSNPYFSPDGKILYFASNREGGFGGIDLYKVTYDDGVWGKVTNLGGKINTAGNEMFPSLSPDGAKFYFSSDGHVGLGGLDVFSTNVLKNSFTDPVNMGKPFNTSYDDLALVFNSEGTGFISSNRPGGKGGDDIYTFKEAKKDPKLLVFNVDGMVIQRFIKTVNGKEEVETTNLKEVNVRLMNAESQVEETTTDMDGKFKFALQGETEYSIIAEKTGFFTKKENVSTMGKTESEDMSVKIVIVMEEVVVDKAIVLKNIYYDYDKADIRPDAAVELDVLVAFLKNNPSVEIELSSHTDDRGSDKYNDALSQARANAAVAYIITKGVDKKRLKAKGYGKRKPVIKNASTEAEHESNRRTEFKVTKMDKTETKTVIMRDK